MWPFHFIAKNKHGAGVISYADTIEDAADTSIDTKEMEENIMQLQQLINELNALDKALMILYLESKNYAEIAEILGITETNVATKLSRIKGKLKKRFADYGLAD